jgi:molybdopterin converting factor subunit 1
LKIKARFFALYRELTGSSELELEVEEGITVAGLKEKVTRDFPQLQGHAHSLMMAVNSEYVAPDVKLSPGDEIAFLPPLSGGSRG